MLLANPINVQVVEYRGGFHQANAIYLDELKLGNKISQILKNAECEVGTILMQELDRLEKEFSSIIVGTELKTPDNG